MITKRLHSLLVASVCLLLAAMVGGVYGASGLLTKEAGKLTILKAKSLALSQQQVALTKAKKDIAKYADLQKITGAIVPEDKNQAAAVREIVNIAAASNINLGSISFPASTLGNLPVASAGASPAAPAPAAAAASNSKANGLSQLLPVKNIPGVYELLITVQSDSNKPVQYDKFISFLSALEHNRRTAQVSAITIQPAKDNRNLLTFTLSLNEYIKP
ncbi:MAG: hypothetical protein WA843_01895 [Candidatus Saccharimonadales bacterium]